MKKILTISVIAAALFSVGSCIEFKGIYEDGSQSVTLSVQLPEVATKAAGAGSMVDYLYYEVYDSEGNCLADSGVDLVSGTANLTFNLMRNATYDVLLWAQKKVGAPYDPTELTKVYMNYKNTEYGLGNDETRDAFTKYVKLTVTDVAPNPVTLTRPFAQLNFVALDYMTPGNFMGTELGNVVIKESRVKVKNLAQYYDVRNGAVEKDADAIQGYFKATGVMNLDGNDYNCDLLEIEKKPTSVSPVDGKTYNNYHISMNYLLVPKDVDCVYVTAEFDVVYSKDNKEVSPQTHKFSKTDGDWVKLNAKANYRTNVRGNIFSVSEDMDVSVDPIFSSPEADNKEY